MDSSGKIAINKQRYDSQTTSFAPDMTLYFPGSSELSTRLKDSDHMMVVCFCAAWCDTCQQYQPKLDQLSQQFPQISFVWADIEDYPELMGDEDIENFPTLLIAQAQQTRFAGTILPHIGHLERLLQAMQVSDGAQATALPDVRSLLISLSSINSTKA